jgi:hypothetical protein
MIRSPLLLLVWAILAAACGMTPAAPPETGGMRPGPGLLTGSSGELVLPGPR